ncbi:hypothetical protein EGW08_001842 [Elysia chlorotica]|uniref:Ashwin n=1 Tax=Elysia chlorotica TaxID=188477 RepID=A0A3S1CEB1_ELYCH|nr:hypothetical protein EGW08_001842 [Elysia chlorotica]
MAAPSSKDSSSNDYFMYPDLLSKDGLLHVLRQRYLSCLHDDLESLEKEALVDLYNRYILPLPQRTYRPNKAGQVMTRCQKMLDRKRKITFPDVVERNSSAKKACVEETSSGLINHQRSPLPSGDRLKPPPSCINFERKRVKLKPCIKMLTDGNETPTSSKSELADTNGNKKKSNTSPPSQQDSSSPKKKKLVPISWP